MATPRKPAVKHPGDRNPLVASAEPQQPEVGLNISRIDVELMTVPIRGTTPLICNRFSEKAKRQMLDGFQGRKTPKQPMDPNALYEAAFYRTKEGYGFPATAFKKATVGAARFYGKSVSMTGLRQALFFKGVMSDNDTLALFEIIGEPRMREDYARPNLSTTTLVYRPEFPEWSTVLTVMYVRSLLTRESVLSLIDAGGMGVGVGDWRPEKQGDFGTYQIDETRDVEVLP
jgi:hypothetical protein